MRKSGAGVRGVADAHPSSQTFVAEKRLRLTGRNASRYSQIPRRSARALEPDRSKWVPEFLADPCTGSHSAELRSCCCNCCPARSGDTAARKCRYYGNDPAHTGRHGPRSKHCKEEQKQSASSSFSPEKNFHHPSRKPRWLSDKSRFGPTSPGMRSRKPSSPRSGFRCT